MGWLKPDKFDVIFGIIWVALLAVLAIRSFW